MWNNANGTNLTEFKEDINKRLRLFFLNLSVNKLIIKSTTTEPDAVKNSVVIYHDITTDTLKAKKADGTVKTITWT